MKKILLTAACAAVFTASAFAGTPSKTVVPPESLWGVGWYGAIEGGVNAYHDHGGGLALGGIGGNRAVQSEASGFAGLKLGYVFGTGNIRFALEEDAFYNGINSTVNGALAGIPVRSSTHWDTGAFMTNILARFNCASRFQPYAGGGVGVYVTGSGNARIGGFGGFGGGPGVAVGGGGGRSGFAWQLVGGADYYFTPKLSTFLEYKFLNYENVLGSSRIGQQLIGAGFRLHF
jgi:opacity protein-like surface antigen